jgi:hypothetical protein
MLSAQRSGGGIEVELRRAPYNTNPLVNRLQGIGAFNKGLSPEIQQGAMSKISWVH